MFSAFFIERPKFAFVVSIVITIVVVLFSLVVALVVTLASLASGGLMNCAGSDPVQGWTAVNLAMVPFLTIAGGALIWLMVRVRPAAA